MADSGRMRLLLGVVGLLLLLRFGLSPLLTWQEETRDAIALLQRQAARTQGMQARLQEMEAAITRHEQAIAALATLYHVTRDAQSMQLLAQKEIEQWVEKEGLKLERVGWGRTPAGEVFSSSMELALEGEYAGVRRFLQQLEGASHFYTLPSLMVTGDRRHAGGVKVKMDLVAHGQAPGADATQAAPPMDKGKTAP